MNERSRHQAHAAAEGALEAASARLSGPGVPRPDVAMILGSGLGAVADAAEPLTTLPFHELPGFPSTTVAGHGGRVTLGLLEGVSCIVFQGRSHLYEGCTLAEVTMPVRLAHRLGARLLLTTNSAGGIAPNLRPGSLMLIAGHISIPPCSLGLRAKHPRANAYDESLLCMVEEMAREEQVLMRQGTYAWVLGPSYETPAEVRALRRLGADAVGMSTVPEILQASALGMPCVGISSITNRAAGLHPQPLLHEEVLNVADHVSASLEKVLRAVLRARGHR